MTTTTTSLLSYPLCNSISLQYNFPNKPKILQAKQTPNLNRIPKPQDKFRKQRITPYVITQTLTLTRFLNSGFLDKARVLFEQMTERDTFVWNCMIRGFTNNGLYEEAIECYYLMQLSGVRGDSYTYPFVIKSCVGLSSMREGWKVHARIVKDGLGEDVFVCNSLIVIYSKLGCVESAERVFDEMPVRDLVSWNSLISGYVSAGYGWKALGCFREMQAEGMMPDRFAIISALMGCYLESCSFQGKEVHSYVVKFGFEFDIMVQTSLIDMYAKFGQMELAERLFNRIDSSSRNIVVWNAMIGGYALSGKAGKAFSCLQKMQEVDNMNADEITLVNLLRACGLLHGKSMHGYAFRKALIPHMVLETALVDMYGNCGELKFVKTVFDGMVEKSLVSWNALLSAYVQNGWYFEALDIFLDLVNGSLILDSVTVASILPAFAEVASLREGMQMHCYITKLGFDLNTFIMNAVVYMYAKCGDIRTARRVFDMILNKDVVSWNTIIMGYAIHGYGRVATELFSKMQEEGMEPNESTFVSVLTSCNTSGLVNEGWKIFKSMKQDYGIEPEIEHYGCMVDILGRTRITDVARRFIEDLPMVPTARIWGSLLTASRNNGDIETAEFAARHISSSVHDNTGCYILLSNMYAEAGRWEDVERIRYVMMEKGFKKTICYSTVELGNKVYRFVNGDKSHEETNRIYNVLDIIGGHIDKDIYAPDRFNPAQLVMKRITSSRYHGVRLAICFSLISTTTGTPIHVRMNLRMCKECHHAAKHISKVTQREIIVGGSRFYHHFKEGRCSCGDYW